MRHITIGVCAAAALLAPAVPAFAEGDVGLSGSANHRRPVPGETQIVRWRFANHGGGSVQRVRIDATVPADWTVITTGRCERVEPGLLRCDLGDLEPHRKRTLQLTMTVPRRPKLGPVRLRATSRFEIDGRSFPGPSASMRLTVVRHR